MYIHIPIIYYVFLLLFCCLLLKRKTENHTTGPSVNDQSSNAVGGQDRLILCASFYFILNFKSHQKARKHIRTFLTGQKFFRELEIDESKESTSAKTTPICLSQCTRKNTTVNIDQLLKINILYRKKIYHDLSFDIFFARSYDCYYFIILFFGLSL